MNPTPDRPLTEAERFPLLNEKGRAMLHRLLEHPHAPRYNFPCGDRLDEVGLARVRAFRKALDTEPGWTADPARRARLDSFARKCRLTVPFYRRYQTISEDFESLPTCDRNDLHRAPWEFVPDDQPLDELIVYFTSGTSGRKLSVYSHPIVSSQYLACLDWMLAREGIRLEGGPDRVGIIQVSAQQATYTHAAVTSFLDQAGYAKINLNPHEWRTPEDRWLFLQDCSPQVLTGDPIAFLALAASPVKLRPRALVSSAMMLLPATRKVLAERFGCPVFDTWSLNEARMIAYSVNDGPMFSVAHDLYIEVLDKVGRPCLPDVTGEITLTGGRNPFLPLLRYRTGDFACLRNLESETALENFEGRLPVVFLGDHGRVVNSIDVTGAMKRFPLAQYSLHQKTDRTILMKISGLGWNEAEVREALLSLFGVGQSVTFEKLHEDSSSGGKVIPYRCDLSEIANGSSLPEFYWQGRD